MEDVSQCDPLLQWTQVRQQGAQRRLHCLVAPHVTRSVHRRQGAVTCLGKQHDDGIPIAIGAYKQEDGTLPTVDAVLDSPADR